MRSKVRLAPWRDRVLRLERVRAGDLTGNPSNWRRHSAAQMEALRGVLSEVGFAGALLAYEDGGKLTLVDGHLRAGLNPEAEVPVLVLDVDKEEARKLLMTYDPLGAMAQPDADAMLAVLREITFESRSVNAMLEALANGETQPMPNFAEMVSPPLQTVIEGRAAEMEQAFNEKFKANMERLVKLNCPECGASFSIQAGDVFKDSKT